MPELTASQWWSERYADLMSKYATLSRQFLDLHADHLALMAEVAAAGGRPPPGVDLAVTAKTARRGIEALRAADEAIEAGRSDGLNVIGNVKLALEAFDQTAVALEVAVKWAEQRRRLADE